MLKCPNHKLPKEIIINNFYARLSCHDKELLDASSNGSFMNKKIDDKWDLIERIQHNTEDWEMNKGKEPGINYEYDCIKSFAKTQNFNMFSAKYGLDSQVIVELCKTFASHVSIPKEKWDKYHEPYKDNIKEKQFSSNEILVNTVDPISL